MRIRENRNCFKSNKSFSELFRCKLDESGSWFLICKDYLNESKLNILFYQYGGS